MTIGEYFKGWCKIIDMKLLYKTMINVKGLYSKHKCLPAYTNIFKAFNVTPYDRLCQVWIGQDPYSNPKYSTGVAFANPNDADTIAPSLKILKESMINFEIPHGSITFANGLSHLSSQGILLLNSALTVEMGKPMSHIVYWREFIKGVLTNLSKYNPGLIYVLWGNIAKSFENFISSNNIVYKMPHPAYYARQNQKIPYEFFTKLSNDNFKYYDRKIEWFKEISE